MTREFLLQFQEVYQHIPASKSSTTPGSRCDSSGTGSCPIYTTQSLGLRILWVLVFQCACCVRVRVCMRARSVDR
jgi:hypothetical protein